MSHPSNDACSVDECGRPAQRSGLCWGHYNGKRRGRAVSRPLRQWQDPRRTLMEAAFAFADASEQGEDEYFHAWRRLYETAARVRKIPGNQGGKRRP